jgi:hypothetical protein
VEVVVDFPLILIPAMLVGGAAVFAAGWMVIMPKVRKRWERRAVAQALADEHHDQWLAEVGADIKQRRGDW